MTKDEEKKKTELGWFLKFQKLCGDCPQTQFVQSSPDILFSDGGLGIEITRYFLSNLDHQLEVLRRKVVRDAQAIYETNFHDHICVSVTWWPAKQCPNRKEQLNLAKALARLAGRFRPISETVSRVSWREFSDAFLERYINQVRVSLVDERSDGRWGGPESLCFGTLDSEVSRFQNRLEEKEIKLAQYRKVCEQVWLLIVAESESFSSSISSHDSLGRASFRSSFDRTFLMDETLNRVTELTIRKDLPP